MIVAISAVQAIAMRLRHLGGSVVTILACAVPYDHSIGIGTRTSGDCEDSDGMLKFMNTSSQSLKLIFSILPLDSISNRRLL